MKRDPSALKYAGAGVLATLAGMAAGHLVAATMNPASSPVLAVGSTVIDLTPTPVKEFAVREFGTRDKPILIGSVMLVTLVLAGLAGLLARRRLPLGAGLLLLLVATSGVLALRRPFAIATDAVPALAAAVVGIGVLAGLVLPDADPRVVVSRRSPPRFQRRARNEPVSKPLTAPAAAPSWSAARPSPCSPGAWAGSASG